MFKNSINCLYFTGSSIGYAADSDILIYKTTDGGINWNPFYGTSWPLTVNRNLRDIWFTNDSTGFVCGGKNFGNGVLFTTQNSGAHWFFREFDHEYRGICFAGSQHGIMCGYGSVLITNNGGVSFRSSGLTKGYYTGCAVDSYGNYWLCSFNGDVLFSSNLGESWSVMRKGDSWGTQQGNFTTIAVHPNGAVVCAGPNGFISWTTDGGNSWASYESFGGTSVHVVKFISENEIIAAGANGKLFKLSL